MRVGDMALSAMKRQASGQRAASSVLDRVAERFDAGRLADDAMVEARAPVERPADELDRAVDRRPLLVAGDEEADRAGKGAAPDEAEGRRRRRRESSLHVAGAASPQLALGDLGRERPEPPAGGVARRHDVGVPGKDEVRRRLSVSGEEVENIRRSGRREGHELGREASAGEEIAQPGQNSGVRGRHRGKGDERARDVERRRERGHQPGRSFSGKDSGQTLPIAPFTSAASRAPVRPSRGRRRKSAARCWKEGSISPSPGFSSGL